MSGPWEKYATQPAGPWQRYAAAVEPKREGLTAGEALKDGAAAVGHGLAKVAGAPVDLLSGALNLGMAGVDAVAGTNLPRINKPFGGSESLSGAYDTAAEAVGMSPPKYEDLPARNKFAHNVAEVGTMFGVGGVVGAARGGAAAIPQAPTLGSMLADTVAPARDMAAKTLAGDAGAVLGTASAQTGIEANREALNSSTAGKVVQALGPIAGSLAGAAGGAGAAAVAGLPAGKIAQAVRPDPTLPVDPATGRPYSPRVVNRAAGELQGSALDPRQAAETASTTARELREQGANVLPAAGYLTDDPGLIGRTDALSRSANNNKASARLAHRGLEVATDARDRLDTIAPGANPRAPGVFAEQRATAMRDDAARAVAEADAQAAALAQEQAAHSAAVGQHADRREAAGAALDSAVVEQGLRPAVARKNEMFGAIDPDGTVVRPVAPYAERVAEIRRRAQALPLELRGEVLPERFLSAIDSLAPRMVERTTASPIMGADGQPITRTEQVNTGGSGQVSMRTLTEMSPLLSSAETQARTAGQYALADNLRSLRQEIGRDAERMAAEGNPRAAAAVENYRSFGEVWARGPGDEATRFRRDFNRDPGNRSTTPPSETAERFLSSPEKAQALARILDSTPDPQAGRQAAREFMLSDLARSGALDNASGRINLRLLRHWIRNNGEVLDAIGARGEFEGIARQATTHEGRAQRLAAELDGASRRQRLTNEEIETGVLGMMTGRDPTHLVEGLLGSKDPQLSLRQAVAALKDSPEGLRGLGRAIAEYVAESATTSNVQRTLNDKRPVSPAKLQNLLDRFGDALPKALPPGEMQKLRASQAQLRPGMNRGLGATAAGPAEAVSPISRALGMVPGGGTAGRVLRAVARAVPDGATPRVNRLVLDALDSQPETLGALLTRRLPEKRPAANWRANTSLGAVIGLQNAD